MKRSLQIMAFGCLVLLSACGKDSPKHVRYIPGDASAVIGFNTELLSSKVAWSTLSGSPMMQEMLSNIHDQKGKDAVQGLDKAGIEWMSTFYVFSKGDKRFSGNNKFGIVLPLKDKKAWEAYLAKLNPGAAIKNAKDRSEAAIDNKAYAAWTDDVLIVMNGMTKDVEMPTIDYDDTTINQDSLYEVYDKQSMVIDEPAAALEMEAIFAMKKENSMAENKRFAELQNEGHDINVFVSYDQMMNGEGLAGMGMMAMSVGKLYKGSAGTMGFDFKKGELEALVKYYPSDEMKEVASKMAASNVDKEMTSRLPGGNLNLVAGIHLAPEGMKMILEKLGFTGMANMALAEQGVTTDDIFKAFTGDIVYSMNNLNLVKETTEYEGMEGMESYESYSPKMEMIFAMKIADKASFQKLLVLLEKSSDVKPVNGTYTIPLGSNENITLTVNDKYLVAGNNALQVAAFINNSAKPGISDVARDVVNDHPFGMYADIQSILKPLEQQATQSSSDSMIYTEARKMVKDFVTKGGEFKGGAITYTMHLNLMNKEENSLVQLIDFGKRMFEFEKKQDKNLSVSEDAISLR